MENEKMPQTVSLTGREQEVLRLLAQGFSTAGIAAELGIRPDTVLGYRKQLHRKFQVSKVAELIFKATELKMI